jgi:hypothetical protein
MSVEEVTTTTRILNDYAQAGNMEQVRVLAKHLASMVSPVGTCPLCGEDVYNYLEEDFGPVWTCPRDLDPNNRYWEPSDVTTEQQDKDEVWSFCYEDHGGYCDDHMPMHSKCYDGLFTTKGE